MPDTAPAKPVVALTLALAGKRRIPAEAAPGLSRGLALVIHAVAGRLASLCEPGPAGDALSLRFTTDSPPRLTLITGLADGADQLASRLFLRPEPAFPEVERVLGAVLPCDRAAFVTRSGLTDTAGFAAAAAACAFVLELDGDMPAAPGPPHEGEGPDARRARAERGRAFRDQSEILLRQADVLIAIDDPRDDGRIGGTRETIRTALDLGMPVVQLRLGHDEIALLRSRADFDEPAPLPESHAREALWALVAELVGAGASAHEAGYVKSLIAEFYAPHSPSPGLLNRLWEGFEGLFKDPAKVPSDDAAAAYQPYRRRASALSAYYASLYRGSFLLGYVLAVGAVLLAVGALAMFPLRPLLGMDALALDATLTLLGMAKLAVVVAILQLASRANHDRLAHRAADYRYLSERLRAMIFLPDAAALRSPYNWSLPYTTRVSAQDVIDRLFLSIVRQAGPLAVIPGVRDGVALRPEAGAALARIRTRWLAGQRRYHERNHLTQHRMSRWLERMSRRLNQWVIAIVIADLALAALGVAGWANWLPEVLERWVNGGATPMLIAMAAILPAAVASLNGVQFQSECSRLADRSEHMASQLRQLEERSSLARLRPIRLLDALRLGEDIAKSTIDEVAEWSAIYGKDFVEM
ncbi:MAG TPA: hypothetical protein VKQ54_09255 [Caulobacteraceae bacterium]|nr:hypothetical protein [Caulobacteraceae bacterium]